MSSNRSNDAWVSYRYQGIGRDRRVFWAAEHRDDVSYDELSKGEKRVRGKFWGLLHPGDGFDPVEPTVAVFRALGLDIGPIPELESRDEFNEYWSPRRLQAIADRWIGHPSTRPWAPFEGKGIVRRSEEELTRNAMRVAQRLVEEAFDVENKASDRIKAQLALLKIAGVGRMKKAPTSAPIKLPADFKENHAAIVPKLFEQCAQDPDVNRGRLRQDGLKWVLAKAMPEVYGDKLDINVQSTFNVVNVLADVKVRRAKAEEKLRAKVLGSKELEDTSAFSLDDILGSE